MCLVVLLACRLLIWSVCAPARLKSLPALHTLINHPAVRLAFLLRVQLNTAPFSDRTLFRQRADECAGLSGGSAKTERCLAAPRGENQQHSSGPLGYRNDFVVSGIGESGYRVKRPFPKPKKKNEMRSKSAKSNLRHAPLIHRCVSSCDSRCECAPAWLNSL